MDKLYWHTYSSITGLGARKTYSPTIYHWYDGTDFRTGKRTFRERISYGSESI
ncbi:MAG: hypothetical protein ACLUBF_00905 [Lachnospira pectinoschiza]